MNIRVDVDVHTLQASAAVRRAVVNVVDKATSDLSAATKANIVEMGAVDTGNMVNTTRGESSGLEGQVTVPADYAVYVHEGHRIVAWGHDTGRYAPPRPFLRRAIDEIRPVFYAALKRAVG